MPLSLLLLPCPFVPVSISVMVLIVRHLIQNKAKGQFQYDNIY